MTLHYMHVRLSRFKLLHFTEKRERDISINPGDTRQVIKHFFTDTYFNFLYFIFLLIKIFFVKVYVMRINCPRHRLLFEL